MHKSFNYRSVLKHSSLNSRIVHLDTSDFRQLFIISIAECRTKLEINSLMNYELSIAVML